MLKNNLCKMCNKGEVCKIKDILYKFDKSAKKPLGVDIAIETCENYVEDKIPEIAIEDLN